MLDTALGELYPDDEAPTAGNWRAPESRRWHGRTGSSSSDTRGRSRSAARRPARTGCGSMRSNSAPSMGWVCRRCRWTCSCPARGSSGSRRRHSPDNRTALEPYHSRSSIRTASTATRVVAVTGQDPPDVARATAFEFGLERLLDGIGILMLNPSPLTRGPKWPLRPIHGDVQNRQSRSSPAGMLVPVTEAWTPTGATGPPRPGPPVRRLVHHRRDDDRHLLPPDVPRPHPLARNVSLLHRPPPPPRAPASGCQPRRPTPPPGPRVGHPRGHRRPRAMRLIADGEVERAGVTGLAGRLGYCPAAPRPPTGR